METSRDLWLIPLFWLFCSLAPQELRLLAVAAGVVLPLVNIRNAPVWLLSSFLFYSTITVPGIDLLLLRVWWLLAYLLHAYLAERIRYSALLLGLWLATLLLVWWSVAVVAGAGHSWSDSGIPGLIRPAIACLWPAAGFAAYHWSLRCSPDPRHSSRFFWSFGLSCLIAVLYGVMQLVFGLNESTVPADILPNLLGFEQYENLGRKTFTFPTPNGFTQVFLLPMVMYLFRWRQNPFGLSLALSIVAIVAGLTLTRSFIGLIPVVVALLFLAPGSSRGFLTLSASAAVALGFWLVPFSDVLLLLDGLRLFETATDSRSLLWTYSLENAGSTDLLFGRGFGAMMWPEFFNELGSVKELASPHNSVLEFGLQFGVIGLAYWVTLLAVSIVIAVRLWGRPESAFVGIVLLCVFAREMVAQTYIISPSMLSGFSWFLLGWGLAQAGAADRGSDASHKVGSYRVLSSRQRASLYGVAQGSGAILQFGILGLLARQLTESDLGHVSTDLGNRASPRDDVRSRWALFSAARHVACARSQRAPQRLHCRLVDQAGRFAGGLVDSHCTASCFGPAGNPGALLALGTGNRLVPALVQSCDLGAACVRASICRRISAGTSEAHSARIDSCCRHAAEPGRCRVLHLHFAGRHGPSVMVDVP